MRKLPILEPLDPKIINHEALVFRTPNCETPDHKILDSGDHNTETHDLRDLDPEAPGTEASGRRPTASGTLNHSSVHTRTSGPHTSSPGILDPSDHNLVSVNPDVPSPGNPSLVFSAQLIKPLGLAAPVLPSFVISVLVLLD